MMNAIHRLKTRLRTLFILLPLAVGLAVSPLHAADLKSAKATGQIGERQDGYLAVVDPKAKPDIHNLVKTVNAKRRANYQKIANKNGVTAADVGRLTAKKVISQAAKGTFIQQPNGKWIKK